MPTLTVRSYHPSSGALLGNISVIDYGKITIGTHSRVKVIDVAFEDLSSIGNVKLGLMSSGGVAVTSGGVGHFGVTSSADFNATTASSPLTNHFTGLNTTGTAGDTNNYAVGNRTSTLSNYIYLDVELGSTNLASGNGSYKVFFDYS